MADASIKMGRFKIIKPLGFGSQGSVYQVEDIFIESVAQKTKALKEYEESKSKEAQREADLLQLCTSEFIVNFLGFYKENDLSCYLLTKFYENGTLKDKIQKNIQEHSVIHDLDVQHYSNQILEALRFLHSKEIVHRDLKPV